MDTVADFLCRLKPAETITLKSGEYLFRQNDACRGIFLVNKGRIKLVRDSIDGHAVIMHIAQSNESLAEASLFSSHYHCHAISDLSSQIYFYTKEQILKLLSSNLTALGFIEVLAKQIQRLRWLLELRGVRSPKERFMQYVQLMAGADKILSVKSSYKDLAITLGMTHETLYRVLAQLEGDNIIAREENKLILLI